MVELSHPYMTTGKTIALTRWTFAGKVMSLLLNVIILLLDSLTTYPYTISFSGFFYHRGIAEGLAKFTVLNIRSFWSIRDTDFCVYVKDFGIYVKHRDFCLYLEEAREEIILQIICYRYRFLFIC